MSMPLPMSLQCVISWITITSGTWRLHNSFVLFVNIFAKNFSVVIFCLIFAFQNFSENLELFSVIHILSHIQYSPSRHLINDEMLLIRWSNGERRWCWCRRGAGDCCCYWRKNFAIFHCSDTLSFPPCSYSHCCRLAATSVWYCTTIFLFFFFFSLL